MANDVTLDALNSFVVFAERLNFTHAAEILHISQPALFVKIQDLSATLGVPLYRKVGRKLELTEQGKKVARFGREIVTKTNSFVDELRTGSSHEPLILAAGEGAYLYLLGPAIREFQMQQKLPLKLLTLNREGIIDAIRSGTAHLGVASLDATPEGMESRLLCKVGQSLVVPRSHALSRKAQVRLTDLQSESLVVPPQDRPHRQMLAAHLQSAGVEWQVAVEATGWQLMLHFVQLGMGLAVVNSCCTLPAGLVAKPLTGLPQIHYHVFHLAGAAKKGPLSDLRKTLIESVRI